MPGLSRTGVFRLFDLQEVQQLLRMLPGGCMKQDNVIEFPYGRTRVKPVNLLVLGSLLCAVAAVLASVLGWVIWG